MELRGSKTEKNLWEAFAGESQARNKYTFFAAKARQDGYEQIGAIFDDTADNERAHAKIWFELLMENGEIPDTLTCLRMAAAGEDEEHTAMYPRMAAEAKEEGFTHIAALFKKVASIEKDHEERYKALAANIEAGKVFAREHEQVWQCRNCGFVYIGRHAQLLITMGRPRAAPFLFTVPICRGRRPRQPGSAVATITPLLFSKFCLTSAP